MKKRFFIANRFIFYVSKTMLVPKTTCLWHLHYSKMTPKPPKCTLVLRSRPKSAFKEKMLNMRLWDHVGRTRREKLVCAIFWKRILIHSVMRTRQNITLGMAFSQNLTFSTPLAPKKVVLLRSTWCWTEDLKLHKLK